MSLNSKTLVKAPKQDPPQPSFQNTTSAQWPGRNTRRGRCLTEQFRPLLGCPKFHTAESRTESWLYSRFQQQMMAQEVESLPPTWETQAVFPAPLCRHLGSKSPRGNILCLCSSNNFFKKILKEVLYIFSKNVHNGQMWQDEQPSLKLQKPGLARAKKNSHSHYILLFLKYFWVNWVISHTPKVQNMWEE